MAARTTMTRAEEYFKKFVSGLESLQPPTLVSQTWNFSEDQRIRYKAKMLPPVLPGVKY